MVDYTKTELDYKRTGGSTCSSILNFPSKPLFFIKLGKWSISAYIFKNVYTLPQPLKLHLNHHHSESHRAGWLRLARIQQQHTNLSIDRFPLRQITLSFHRHHVSRSFIPPQEEQRREELRSLTQTSSCQSSPAIAGSSFISSLCKRSKWSKCFVRPPWFSRA